MITLNIDQFSCIESAQIRMSPVTVLVGPQGSGKSVTAKLYYFFYDFLINQYSCAEKGVSTEEFKRDAVRQFGILFPSSAWGRNRFNINFVAGQFTVRILRRMRSGVPSDEVSIKFSDFFVDHYKELRASYEDHKTREFHEDGALLRRSLDGLWKIRERSEKTLSKELGDSFVSFQMFIPAGRAFFTSIGRLVAAFEPGSNLDPVTVRFAKLFANIRDYASRRLLRIRRGENEENVNRRREIMSNLFGGEIKLESNLEFIETKDGRKVPFVALSSGQQELLPMWMLLEYFSGRNFDRGDTREVFYIEEPEAHLFPAAQSLLMDFLVGDLASEGQKRSLFLTTHSPYILAKLNNYLKAGFLGRQRKNIAAVSAIVPKECWLKREDVSAYALDSGKAIDLLTDEGLINGSYIDAVSDDVSRTFQGLLDIQYPETVE